MSAPVKSSKPATSTGEDHVAEPKDCCCKQKKRQRILDAAARAFPNEHFHKVSTEGIAAAAGVGKGTLFRYFPSKEKLFVATLCYSVEVATAEIDRALAGLTDPLERLETLCEHLFAFYRQNNHLFHLLHHHKALHDQGHGEVWEKQCRLRGKITEMIEDGIKLGRFRHIDPVVSGRLLFGMLRTAMRSPELKDRTPGDVASTILDIFIRGVGKPHADALPEGESAAPPGNID
jgi:AcrR family transcriptional regulator